MTDWTRLKTTLLAGLLTCSAALAQHPRTKAHRTERKSAAGVVKKTTVSAEKKPAAGTEKKAAPSAEKKPAPRSSYCLDVVEDAENKHLPELKLAPKLVDLGDAYKREGATMEAIPVYERALAIYKKEHQSSSARAIEGQMALADLFEDSGRYDKSAQVYTEALNNAGASEQYQTEILPNLASVTVKAGKLQAAEPIFKRTLTVTEKHYGQADQHVAQVLLGYADLLNKLNRQPEANKFIARAKGILEKKQNPVHPAH